jgi:hypothetical protein
MRARSAARSIPVVLTALVVSVSPAARAQDLDLAWDAPAGCPTADDVKSEFRRSLHLAPGHVPPTLSAGAVVDHTGEHWTLHMHIARNGVASDRDIEADSCTSLARAAALILTLALGEGDMGEAPSPAVEPRNEPPPPLPPVAPAAPADTGPSLRRRPLAWSTALDARAAWGPTPGPSLGVASGVDVRGAWWALRARAEASPGASQRPAPGLHTSYEDVGGALSFCVLGSPSSFLLLSVCAGAEATAIHGGSSGGTRGGDAVAPWYAGLGSLRARVPVVDALHLDVGFEIAASITRPRFVVDGLGDVYEVPELSPSIGGGLLYDL